MDERLYYCEIRFVQFLQGTNVFFKHSVSTMIAWSFTNALTVLKCIFIFTELSSQCCYLTLIKAVHDMKWLDEKPCVYIRKSHGRTIHFF